MQHESAEISLIARAGCDIILAMAEKQTQVKLRRMNVLLWMTIDDTTAHQLMPYVIGHIRRTHLWNIIPKQVLPNDLNSNIRWKKIDGIIANLNTRDNAVQMLAKKKSLVNVGDDLESTGVPGVHVDNHAVGRMAAEYLLECGMRHFACVGIKNRIHACRRWNGFNDELKRNRIHPACYYDLHYDSLGNLVPDVKNFAGMPLERWIRTLEKPVGIFCVNDDMGHVVSDACRVCRIAVPHDAMILGVDNNIPQCNAAYPRLSSIEQPMEQIAQRAVEMLEERFNSRSEKLNSEWIPPVRVVTRQSTDHSAVSDNYVQHAMEYIQHNAQGPLSIEEVVRQAPVCRSLLERRFRAILGSTILKEINRARINHIKKMLLETDMTLDELAHQCRFSSPSRLTKLFKQVTGFCPSEYRTK